MFRSQLTLNVLAAFLLCSKGITARIDAVSIPSTQIAPAILEVIDHYQGMWPFAGKYIHLRLFGNGRYEYEKLRKSVDNSKWEAVRQEGQLSPQQLADIIQLVKNKSFIDAREKYRELWHGIDALYNVSISYSHNQERKQILLINFDPKNEQAKNYYPESVLKLMKKVEELREQEK
jgi:hypothetical protein